MRQEWGREPAPRLGFPRQCLETGVWALLGVGGTVAPTSLPIAAVKGVLNGSAPVLVGGLAPGFGGVDG